MNAPCVYLCFTPLSVPETSFSTPAANLLAPHRNPNSAATGRLFVWLCHYWTEAHRLGGWEERISTDSLWRVHLLKLCPSRAMFRLEVWGTISKLFTLFLDDLLVGEICIAEILSGLMPPSFTFFLDLNADLQIRLMGWAWINMGKDRHVWALRIQKFAQMHKHL